MALVNAPAVARIPQATRGSRHVEPALQPRKRPRRSEHVSGHCQESVASSFTIVRLRAAPDVRPSALRDRKLSRGWHSGLNESGPARAIANSPLARGLIVTMQDPSMHNRHLEGIDGLTASTEDLHG